MIKHLFVFSAVLLAAVPVFAADTQEKITVTTYYPSPYGVYNQLVVRQDLRIVPHSEGEVSLCAFETKGTLYYDETEEVIKICKKKADGTYGFEPLQGEIGLGTRVALPEPTEDGCSYTNSSHMEDGSISTRAEARFTLPNVSPVTPEEGSVTWDFGSARINALNVTFATGSMCAGPSGQASSSSSVVQVSSDNLNWYDLATVKCPIACEPLGANMLYGNSQTKIFTSPVRYIRVKNKASRSGAHGTQWAYFYMNELAAYE